MRSCRLSAAHEDLLDDASITDQGIARRAGGDQGTPRLGLVKLLDGPRRRTQSCRFHNCPPAGRIAQSRLASWCWLEFLRWSLSKRGPPGPSEPRPADNRKTHRRPLLGN